MRLYDILLAKPAISSTVPEYASDSALHVFGTAENIARLSNVQGLRHLYITNIRERELHALIALGLDIETLYLYNCQVADLSVLRDAVSLKFLLMDWNTKNSGLPRFRNDSPLRGLYVNDFKRLTTLESLWELRNLRYLNISGGITTTLKLDSLAPIGSLQQLEELALYNLNVERDGLRPLASLAGLKELELSNQFATDEYAFLAVQLPHARCLGFQPYIRIERPVSDADCMIVGKRKPFLHSVRDAEKIQRYVEEFDEMKERYRDGSDR